jgi:arylsulfatase A-like enzyme
MIKIIAGLCVGTVLSFSQAHAKTAQHSEASETALAPVPSLAGKDPPNILFIITDDMQRSMFNALPEGKGRNLTPNLDRLVSEGVLMTGQHVASAVCTPSRYNVLTGHYASLAMANGLHDQAVVGFETHIKPLDATLPKFLRDAGYRTGMVGKTMSSKHPAFRRFPWMPTRATRKLWKCFAGSVRITKKPFAWRASKMSGVSFREIPMS